MGNENLAIGIIAVIFLLFGAICLFWPYGVQQIALKWSSRSPFYDYIKTPGYIRQLRLLGILSASCAIGLLYLKFFIGHS